MHAISADRWLAAGTVFAGLGGTAGVGYWLFGLQASPREEFWQLPGYLSVGVFVVGMILLGIGFMAPNGVSRQVQKGGKRSINVQAGRDVVLRSGEGEEQINEATSGK